MLLQRLIEYAASSPDVVPAFYGRKPVRFVLHLDGAGRPRGALTDLADKDVPDHKFGPPRLVPAITRAMGIAPAIAADNVEYVLGWVTDGGNEDRVARQHAAFRDLNDDWANAEGTAGGPARAIAAFYRDGHAAQLEQPATWSRSDLVAFEVDDTFAAETTSAQRFWATVADRRKGSGLTGLCLVCGQTNSLLKTIPQQIPQRWLPGASHNASLISVNKSTHGFELRKFLGHTPICVGCGLNVMSALTALLSSPRNSSGYSGQDARLAWWLTEDTQFDPMTFLDQPDEQQVQQLLASAATGVLIDPGDLSRFCAVVVSGNAARVVVREWVELPLTAVNKNLAAWFGDLVMVDAWTGAPTPVGLTQLVRVLGRWHAGRGTAPGSWTKFGSSGEDRPDGAYRALLRTALLGKALPPKLLSHVVRRIRIDGRVDTARVALIRIALRRHPATTKPEVYMPTLNVDDGNPSYLSGRLFAVLEDLQRTVQRFKGGEGLNVTFTDRYFARAVTSPMVALVAGRRDARAWLKRLRRDRPTWAIAYERRLDDLFTAIAEAGGMPVGAVLTQQAAFILGYHQQRAAFYAERLQAAADKQTDLPPVPDEHDPATVPASQGAAE